MLFEPDDRIFLLGELGFFSDIVVFGLIYAGNLSHINWRVKVQALPWSLHSSLGETNWIST